MPRRKQSRAPRAEGPPSHPDPDLRSAIDSIKSARMYIADPEGTNVEDLDGAIRCLADAIESLVVVVSRSVR